MPYGYPLARDFRQRLEAFGLSVAPSAPRLSKLVGQTVRLFAQLQAKGIQADTLDELAWHMHQKVLYPYPQCHFMMEEAKLAVTAFFMSLEPNAMQFGLPGYRNWMKRIFSSSFGTTPHLALKQTPYRILTFNYDRLFELAYRQYFPYDGTTSFYGPEVLNSGLFQAMPEKLEITPNRFSFLKLHGSVGVFTYELWGQTEHIHEIPDPAKQVPITDEYFFMPADFHEKFYANRPKPALLVFPHEKDFLKDHPSNALGYRHYIPAVWTAARSMASQAEEIWIVGYSCPEPDFPAWSSLLQAAGSCQRIVVQNPSATDICTRIKMRLPRLTGALEAYPQPFEVG